MVLGVLAWLAWTLFFAFVLNAVKAAVSHGGTPRRRSSPILVSVRRPAGWLVCRWLLAVPLYSLNAIVRECRKYFLDHLARRNFFLSLSICSSVIPASTILCAISSSDTPSCCHVIH